MSAERVPIPALLATAAVHHHLIRRGLRTQTGLVVEIGRGARGPSFLLPGGLWRRGGEPLSRLRDPRAASPAERPAAEGLRGAEELHQGGRQGPAEGHVQDGHLDLPVLLRRADLRRGRPAFGLRREVFHRHRHHDRGRGLAGDRRGDGAPPPRRLRRQSDLSHHARCRRRLCLPPARRGSCLDARQRRQAAARRARQLVGRVQGLRRRRSTSRASGC